MPNDSDSDDVSLEDDDLYELRDPLSVFGLVAAAFIALLILLGTVLLG